MDRRQKKSLRRRLLTIYVGYFIVLMAGFIYGFLPDFTSGFTRGLEMAGDDPQNPAYMFPADLELGVRQPLVPAGIEREGIDVEIETTEVLVSVKTSDAADPEIVGQLTDLRYSSVLLVFPVFLVKLAILVLLALIINILRVSVRGEQVLPRRIVSYTRAIALLLLLVTLLDAVGGCVYHHVAEVILEGSGLTVASSIGIDYWAIFMAIMIFFSAEVFSIGSKLGEEQKLTI